MSGPPSRSERSSPLVTPTRVVIGICLSVPFVAMLWVGSYARVEPTLGGLPFFYWYQMLWVPITAGLTAFSYWLLKRERRNQDGGEAR